MKKIFKNWSIFEFIILVASPIVILTVGIVFHNDICTILSSAIGIIGTLLIAKGITIGQFFGIIAAILYSIVSFNNAFYGEMIIYILFMLPMYIWNIVEWTKHKNHQTKNVEVNSIKWKEWLVVCVCAAAIFVGFYFLLKAFNTNELIISTLSVLCSVFAVYLLARRSKYGFVSYIVNDLILIVLWGIPVIQGNLLVLTMLINSIVNLINDSYGVINWTKLQKQQKSEDNDNAVSK